MTSLRHSNKNRQYKVLQTFTNYVSSKRFQSQLSDSYPLSCKVNGLSSLISISNTDLNILYSPCEHARSLLLQKGHDPELTYTQITTNHSPHTGTVCVKHLVLLRYALATANCVDSRISKWKQGRERRNTSEPIKSPHNSHLANQNVCRESRTVEVDR